MVVAVIEYNKVTIRNTNMSPVIDEFSESFAGLPISFLVDLYSGYDQVLLAKKS